MVMYTKKDKKDGSFIVVLGLQDSYVGKQRRLLHLSHLIPK